MGLMAAIEYEKEEIVNNSGFKAEVSREFNSQFIPNVR